jgi:hypothetical protein
MFIDLGVDVLNPVQATANDLNQVRSITDERMALQGGVNSATIMEGPAERITSEAQHRMLQLGRNGGYFCGPDQYMPYPLQHLDVLNRAVAEYGRYPLCQLG